MRLSGLRELGQRLLLTHGHVAVPVLLGILFLVSGLGHAFFNPTGEAAAGVLLFVGIFLAHDRRTRAALVCYGISAGCVVITVIMQVGILIRQVSQ
jgi:membrane-associated PAP2 superfamily phosphatase